MNLINPQHLTRNGTSLMHFWLNSKTQNGKTMFTIFTHISQELPLFHRSIVDRSLQWTVKEFISKCNDDQGYNPDEELMKTVLQATGCNLPWSIVQIQNLETCSEPKDYHNYLNALENLQSHIKNNPKKCIYNGWTSYPF